MDKLLICSLLIASMKQASSTWSYDPSDTYGPQNWGVVDDKCNGQKQSPIDINTATVVKTHNTALGSLTLGQYWNTSGLTNASFRLKNKGYTLQLDIQTNGNQKIETTQKGKTWQLAQFHLHWNNVSANGSEHTIDGKTYPGEIHFVHFNPKYANLGAAVPNVGGLMVVGFFLEITNTSNPALDPIFNLLQNITESGNSTTLNTVNLTGIVESAMNGGYYHYLGSLTTPTCDESVTWNVMKTSLPVTQAQMDQLRTLKPKKVGGESRFRPVQGLHGRLVRECCQNSGTNTWQYNILDPLGPLNWGTVNALCDGTSQSPINIVTSAATMSSTLKPLELGQHWNTSGLSSATYTLKNKGYTVQLDVKTNDVNKHIETTQGGNTWRLAQFHLHWSNHNDNGSEHTVDGMEYPGEIHFVHYQSRYADLGAAATNKGGLMVMGFFLKINNSLSNPALDAVFNKFTEITSPEANTTLSKVDFKTMVPSDALKSYYHYPGSLTTPGCYETVTWNVMKTPLYVTDAQMAKLRTLEPHVAGNEARYRPVQSLNDRTVLQCCEEVVGSGSYYVVSSFISFLVPVITFFTLG